MGKSLAMTSRSMPTKPSGPSHSAHAPRAAGLRAHSLLMVLAAALALASPVLARGEQCPDDGTAPVPVEVTVTAVPIVVTSTTADYFADLIREALCPGGCLALLCGLTEHG